MLQLSVVVVSARLSGGKVLLESSVRIQGINRDKVNPAQENTRHFLGNASSAKIKEFYGSGVDNGAYRWCRSSQG